MQSLTKFLTPDGRPYFLLADGSADNFQEMIVTHGGFNTVAKILWGLLEPKSVFFDIGANIGSMSMPMAAKGATTYAFEILADNVAAMKEGASASAVVLDIHHVAVWRHDGEVSIVGHSAWGHVQDGGEVKVKAVTIDNFVMSHNIDKVDVIKMDIEGAELAAFEGMKSLLERERPDIVFESNPYTFLGEYSYYQSLSFLSSLGYRIYRIFDSHLAPFAPSDVQEVVCCDYLASFTRASALATLTGLEVRETTTEEFVKSVTDQQVYGDVHCVYSYVAITGRSGDNMTNPAIQALMEKYSKLAAQQPELVKSFEVNTKRIPGYN